MRTFSEKQRTPAEQYHYDTAKKTIEQLGVPCVIALRHDELTLEMVTDMERDYMYDAYAESKTMRLNLGIRRRLAPCVGQQPQAHRVNERDADVVTGHSYHLLRR
jgi:hypothetical protein